MVLKVSLLTAHVRLSDCRRDCAVDRRFEFDKRSQLFIRTHDETVIAVAMCISNEDCWPVAVGRSCRTRHDFDRRLRSFPS